MKKAAPKLSLLARLIVKAGETNYGPEWQRQLAKKADVSQQMFSAIVNGAKPATPHVGRKVAVAIAKNAADLEKISKEILANIGTVK